MEYKEEEKMILLRQRREQIDQEINRLNELNDSIIEQIEHLQKQIPFRHDLIQQLFESISQIIKDQEKLLEEKTRIDLQMQEYESEKIKFLKEQEKIISAMF